MRNFFVSFGPPDPANPRLCLGAARSLWPPAVDDLATDEVIALALARETEAEE